MNVVQKVLQGMVALGLFGALVAHAETFVPRMDQSNWLVNASVFECSLAQDIPFYGEAVFARRAGEKSSFYLKAKSERLQAGEALVKAVQPIWKQSAGAETELARVAVRQGGGVLVLDWGRAEKVLARLHGGQEIEIVRQPWYDTTDQLSIRISNINFRAAYDKYLTCLGSLLPVNYDQVERTSIYFRPGVEEMLSAAAKRKLDNILIYAGADKSVVAFYIDGHSDSRGARAENLALSQARAELVKSYLANRGVPPEHIAVRWHGERYPVATNRTASGRALNRRVTVRLDKTPLPEAESIEPLPMVAAPAAARNI